jgi:hypothetical protein
VKLHRQSPKDREMECSNKGKLSQPAQGKSISEDSGKFLVLKSQSKCATKKGYISMAKKEFQDPCPQSKNVPWLNSRTCALCGRINYF